MGVITSRIARLARVWGDFVHFHPPRPDDGDGDAHLKVGNNFFRRAIVGRVGRGLALLQDPDRSLGLLNHTQDAIQHLKNIQLKLLV